MDILSALKTRRSINFFDPHRDIKQEDIDEIIDAANHSPSSFNLQPWEVIVVKDHEQKTKLRECAFNQQKIEDAPVTLILIANPGSVEEHVDRVIENMVELGYMSPEDGKKNRNAPFSLYGEPDSLKRKLFAVKNTAFFGMCIMIAARGKGLETHPMDGFKEEKVKTAFGIPENRIIPMLIAVGYQTPGLILLPKKLMRPKEEFVFMNHYPE